MERIRKSMSISFNPDIFVKIDSYCETRGCSRSWFINKAASLFLEQCLEDKADYDAAVAAWKEHEESGGRTYTADEVRRKLKK